MIWNYLRRTASVALASTLVLGMPGSLLANGPTKNAAESYATKTPIKHVIIIFGENISFDHYFGTYPHATNPTGEPAFHAKGDTPRVNNLLAGGLLDENPNSTQPFRMDTGLQSVTCDQNHSYTPEQQADDHGLMDKFPEFTGTGNSASSPCNDYGKGVGVVMGYFDGNTVQALWNYAQHYALNDNAYGTEFGPSTVGAVNLVAGTTENATMAPLKVNGKPASGSGNIANGLLAGSLIGDVRPLGDECVLTDPGLQTANLVSFSGKTVGDLLNAKNISWGWFQGGFRPTGYDANNHAICGQHHVGLAGDDAVTQSSDGDYIPHHEPFQFFASTLNAHHVAPSDPSLIGTSADGAKHQYDLADFWTALGEDRLPAVTYLKAGAYQDAHPGYSDPIDEQVFVVGVINAIMNSPYWKDTAIFINYDDSDGWYDHVLGPVVNQSAVSDDELAAASDCGSPSATTQGQCGYGPRIPILLISPFAKQNYVDHRIADQSSTLRFIEENWDLGSIGGNSSDTKAGRLNGMFDFDGPTAPKLILDPSTGVVLPHQPF
ncbi:MAG TPA: alkaline phosphatase family protein [Candidatus Baltobacteraceae bacterium]|nr:alkaline phosphatase family protein [Candidatus Baltobacteraceae bacterium]